MTLPGVLLGIVISSLAGLVYHLIRGGSFRRLLLYVITSWIAFFAGHFLGALIGWTTLRVGSLNLLPALLSSVLVLILADIMAGPRGRPARKTRSTTRRDR
jgi:uncharacterized membrane protein YfcA